MNLELTTLGIGMEAIGTRAVHNGFYERFVLEFLPPWAQNLVVQVGLGRGRAS